jgi:uncharacterized protein (TIGR00375 family)
MISQTLDLHIHSKYSRACSKYLEFPNIAQACEERGIDIVVTGDMTHPAWHAAMLKQLKETQDGIFQLKDGSSKTKFLIGTELSSIKKHHGKTRRIHVCAYAPDFAVLEKFNKKLDSMGFNLKSDGRPILGLTCKQILELMLETDERMRMIPAHIWTPWFGLLGSKGGYDSVEECFEELTPHIKALETGLSSDPLMNWRLSALDRYTLVSSSDAHSPQKLGREANVLAFQDEAAITYDEIFRIIESGNKDEFLHTIEFYPEEGKYHADGHRECNVCLDPEETQQHNGKCPTCKKPLTVGVLNRVYELADRTQAEAFEFGKTQIPYKSIVPLPEVLADTFQCGVNTKKVRTMYEHMITDLGNEFSILIDLPISSIAASTTPAIAEAIRRMRIGDMNIRPGYDGEFGVVKIFKEGEERGGVKQ